MKVGVGQKFAAAVKLTPGENVIEVTAWNRAARDRAEGETTRARVVVRVPHQAPEIVLTAVRPVAPGAAEVAVRSGEPVTMALVKSVIASELGEEAGPMLSEHVYKAASIWERSVNATRRRART